jgi:DNA polymerase III sliding clamp (beta) subunit (PCNA family)
MIQRGTVRISEPTLGTQSVPAEMLWGRSVLKKEGYTIKALTEFLSAYFANIQPILSSEGIKMYCIDPGYTHSFIITLNASNFINYSCQNKLEIGINTVALHCLLKRIRKKDSLSLSIMSDAPDEMNIRIYQTDVPSEGRAVLKIVRAQATEIEVPNDYPEPINVSGKDFQKDMKELKDIGRVVEVSTEDGGATVKFSSAESGMYSRDKIYGNKLYARSDNPELVRRHYNISVFTTLSKIIGLSSIVSLFVTGRQPLRIDFKVGSLGSISAYIKSNEEIRESEETKEQIP